MMETIHFAANMIREGGIAPSTYYFKLAVGKVLHHVLQPFQLLAGSLSCSPVLRPPGQLFPLTEQADYTLPCVICQPPFCLRFRNFFSSLWHSGYITKRFSIYLYKFYVLHGRPGQLRGGIGGKFLCGRPDRFLLAEILTAWKTRY